MQVIAISADDPKAALVNDIEDVEKCVRGGGGAFALQAPARNTAGATGRCTVGGCFPP